LSAVVSDFDAGVVNVLALPLVPTVKSDDAKFDAAVVMLAKTFEPSKTVALESPAV
jgi:hypothetical protein